jgi:flagellar protein FliS
METTGTDKVAEQRPNDETVMEGGDLILRLYDGAIRFCQEAIKLMLDGNADGKCEPLDRAGAIIKELRRALDFSRTPELCSSLESLYLFMEEQIQRVKDEDSTERISNVVKILETLRSGWEQVIERTRKGKGVND